MVSSPYLEFVNFGINKIQSKKIFIETESIISKVEAISRVVKLYRRTVIHLYDELILWYYAATIQ